jgi:EAL domain-containing protein (putative c-di-GMP-specific phosphodiesterase class I)
VSLQGERLLPPLAGQLEGVARQLVNSGALGILAIDATPLLEIERIYGARAFRKALDALAQRVRTRVEREVSEPFLMTAGALEEEHLILLFGQPREDREFYVRTLPWLAQEVATYVALCLKRIVYPYLGQPPELAVGHGVTLYRPFHRPETQIRKLLDATLRSAHFELEKGRRERSASLQRAIFEESITSVYQPIVRLSDRRPIGYEALTRGPVGTGLENPLTLFMVAEDADLEFELDALCRRRALENATGLEAGLKLFVNILPTSIHHPDFESARMRETFEALGIAPSNVVLEISERQAISNFHIFREAIDHFSKLGFGIAVDDIGAGYSSFEAAMELSPDYLKIDMSLVRGIDDDPQKQELLRGLQSLAGKMNATVIAEGIESSSELETVRSLGIECGQGYLIGRAGPLRRSPKRSARTQS